MWNLRRWRWHSWSKILIYVTWKGVRVNGSSWCMMFSVQAGTVPKRDWMVPHPTQCMSTLGFFMKIQPFFEATLEWFHELNPSDLDRCFDMVKAPSRSGVFFAFWVVIAMMGPLPFTTNLKVATCGMVWRQIGLSSRNIRCELKRIVELQSAIWKTWWINSWSF